MSPGTYLRKRREATGLAIDVAAGMLAVLPDRLRPLAMADVHALEVRIEAAEADEDNLTVLQAMLLRKIMRFDLTVYETLLLRHHAGPFAGLPEPRVCRDCACSWHDSCIIGTGHDASACAWSTTDPGLCTACETAAAQPEPVEGRAPHGGEPADWPDAPLPEGEHA